MSTSGGAQDLRISVPASCQQQQQQQQQDEPVSYRAPVVTERQASGCPPVSAPPLPSFGLGLFAVGPHTSLSVVPTTPATSSAAGAALSVPVVGQSQSPSAARGELVRRRVSDKTALPASTGKLQSAHKLDMFYCTP